MTEIDVTLNKACFEEKANGQDILEFIRTYQKNNGFETLIINMIDLENDEEDVLVTFRAKDIFDEKLLEYNLNVSEYRAHVNNMIEYFKGLGCFTALVKDSISE